MTHPSMISLVVRAAKAEFGDPWLHCLLLWLPPALFCLLWAILSAGQARDLPIGVVDLDDSVVSRALVRHYDGSPSLAVTARFTDPHQGTAALRAGSIYALVILPAHLERDTRLGRAPQISARVNQQFLLVGRMINGALTQAHGDFVTRLETGRKLAELRIAPAALAEVSPVAIGTVPLYNPNTDYAQFLVSAMLPAAWQILIVAAAVLALSTCRRRLGLRSWLGERPTAALLASLLPPFLTLSLHGLLMLLGMFTLLDWPMRGSWLTLAAAQLLTVAAAISVGALCYFLTLDGARGLSLAAAYAAPGLAYMGVTYPAGDMNQLAALWRQALPISHYMEIQMAQANAGVPWVASIPQLLSLSAFLVLLLFPILRAQQLANIPEFHPA